MLSDAYCRLNRARSMAGLISPEDLLNACKELNKMDLKIKYLIYTESNLHVLQINELIENNIQIENICKVIEENKCLTADKLSKLLSLNSLVVKQQLIYAEKIGKLCRDDTAYGLNSIKKLKNFKNSISHYYLQNYRDIALLECFKLPG